MSRLSESTSSLLCTPIEKIIPLNQQLVVITPEQSLSLALNTLVKHSIYSAPVVDMYKGIHYGFLDLSDIVQYLVDLLTKEKGEIAEDLYAIIQQAEKFDSTNPTAIADLSKRNPLCVVKKSAPVVEAMEAFVLNGVHRVAVLENNAITNVLTQSAVVDWLAGHMEGLGYLSLRTVRELGMGYKEEVVCINRRERALDAFKLMSEKKVNGVGIVDDQGKLITNLSAKDIKILLPGLVLTKLYRSCEEYAMSVRRGDSTAIDHLAALHCHEDTTLSEVIKSLAEMKIHRLYLLDKNSRPIGVVSLVDVIKVIVQENETRVTKWG